MPLHPPLPTGWFAVCQSRELRSGVPLTVRVFGRELVAYRGEDGQARVVEPVCPHLGAHLGGGRVVGCNLRFPMHGFEFAPQGACVSTPYGTPPKMLSLRTLQVAERVGFVFVWRSDISCTPAYSLPEVDQRGYSGLSVFDVTFTGHPQETSENGVDIGHFKEVHGYTRAERLLDPHADGAIMRSGFAVYRGKLRLEFRVAMHGLGFSVTDAGFPELRVWTRIFSFATPLEQDLVRVRFCSSAKAPFGLRSLIALFTHRTYVHDVRQDIRIWERKQHVTPPQLIAEDAPIAAYRKWAKQFYPATAGE